MSEEDVSFSAKEVENCPENSGNNYGKRWGAFKAVITKAELAKTKDEKTKRTDTKGNVFYRINLTIAYNNETVDKNTFFGFNIYPKFIMGEGAQSLQKTLGFEIEKMFVLKNYINKDIGIIIGSMDAWGDKEEFEGKEVSEYKGNRFIRKGILRFMPYKDVEKEWSVEDEANECSLHERFKNGTNDSKTNKPEDEKW